MTREQEIARIRKLMEKKLNDENVHRLYIAAMTFWQIQ